MLFLDTDVMVDVHRGHEPALQWLAEDRSIELALPGIVAMQLLDGCSTKLEAKRMRQWIEMFRRYWPTIADAERALELHSDSQLSHGVDVADMLIAQTAVGRGIPLATFNTKHFGAIPDLVIERPYQR